MAKKNGSTTPPATPPLNLDAEELRLITAFRSMDDESRRGMLPAMEAIGERFPRRRFRVTSGGAA